MKREDIKKLFENATDDQISALLNINSADIGAAKGEFTRVQGELTESEKKLKAAQDTITALEATKGESTKMKEELDKYKAEDEQRKKDEEAAKARKGAETRFDAAVGTDRKFVHEFVRTGVFGEFEKALSDPANTGKSDKDVFDAITKDKDYFASQNPQGNMGGANPAKTAGGVEAAFMARNPGITIP